MSSVEDTKNKAIIIYRSYSQTSLYIYFVSNVQTVNFSLYSKSKSVDIIAAKTQHTPKVFNIIFIPLLYYYTLIIYQ